MKINTKLKKQLNKWKLIRNQIEFFKVKNKKQSLNKIRDSKRSFKIV